jgi:hypothetical protein
MSLSNLMSTPGKDYGVTFRYDFAKVVVFWNIINKAVVKFGNSAWKLHWKSCVNGG